MLVMNRPSICTEYEVIYLFLNVIKKNNSISIINNLKYWTKHTQKFFLKALSQFFLAYYLILLHYFDSDFVMEFSILINAEIKKKLWIF